MKWPVLTFVYMFKLAESTQQSWEFPNCNASVEYSGHTLKIEKECEQQFSEYTFLLYPAEAHRKRCQWTNFTQQRFSTCESLSTFSQKKTLTFFEHVYNGTFCLAIYHKEWTSSLPICNSNVPFYLETKLTELDVNQWNPRLNIQQHGSKYCLTKKLRNGRSSVTKIKFIPYVLLTSDLFIRLGINHSDGFNFDTFDIEVYNVDEDVKNCDQLAILLTNYSIKIRVSNEKIILSNLKEGYYCFQVTPIDSRCIHPFSVSSLPCTRSSNSTRITFPFNRSDHTAVVGAISTFLFLCTIVAASFLKKKRQNSKDRNEYSMLKTSIFLLHSNEERHQSNIQMLKKTLQERLPSCEIDDYTDEHQWESVAEEGIGWFLSRLHQEGKYIIVIEPILEEALESENIYFVIGLQQLQTLVSSPDFRRVLTVWFQNNIESGTNDSLRLFGNPFRNFKFPSESNLLVKLLNPSNLNESTYDVPKHN